MSEASVDATAMLRDVELRVTRQRVAVVQVLAGAPHADTETVTALARGSGCTISGQATYDVLRVLTDAGLARRIEPAGSVARYELRVGDNHHHLVCRSCGTIADVDRPVGDISCLTAPSTHDFAVDQAEVIYWGLCPQCQAPVDGPAVPADQSPHRPSPPPPHRGAGQCP